MSALPNVLAVRRGARTVTAVLVAFVLVSASAASAQAVTPETYAVSHVAQLGDRPFADVDVDESTHDVFAPNYDDGTVSIVNGSTVRSVAVGDSPMAVALNQGTDTAYVLNQGRSGSPTMAVVRGGVVTDTVAVGGSPITLAVDQSDGTIYVANAGNALTVIDPVTLAMSTVPLTGVPFYLAVDSATHTVYVGLYNNGSAVIRGGAVVMTAPGGDEMVFNEVNRMAYTMDYSTDTVYAIDGVGGTVSSVTAGNNPSFLAINQTTGTVYVANKFGQSVTVIDGTTVTDTIELSSTPGGIAADNGSDAVFVVLRDESRLAVIEGSTVVASPLVGRGPAVVTVDSSTGTAYVVNETSGTLATVIKTTLEQRPFIVSAAPWNGKADTVYSFDVLATGNPAPTSFAVIAGALPAGLTINATTGAITGTPTEDGSFPFTLTVANGTSPNATADYTLVIDPSDITSGPPPSGTVGSAFNFEMTTVPDSDPARFSVTAGSLPPGLTVSTSGVISGTPTMAGSFPVTIRAIVRREASTVNYTIEILAAPVPAVITSSAPGGGTVGVSYSFLVTASGVPAPTFAVDSGILPPGLTLNAASGAITGAPSQPGNWLFTLSATSVGNPADTADYAMTIAAAPTVTPDPDPDPTDTPDPASPVIPPAGEPTDLASTGVDVRAPLLIATMLLVAGAGLFIATRRRNA